MWVVTRDTLTIALVAPIYDLRQFATRSARVFDITMASQAKAAFLVERQELDVVRVVA
jgi:hypothetical protein